MGRGKLYLFYNETEKSAIYFVQIFKKSGETRMREKNRKPIASIKKFPQFTTMHVIDGQAGLIICASLLFYSLTIDNILNIVVLLILAATSISMLPGDNGIITNAQKSKEDTIVGEEKEQVELAYVSAAVKKLGGNVTKKIYKMN